MRRQSGSDYTSDGQWDQWNFRRGRDIPQLFPERDRASDLRTAVITAHARAPHRSKTRAPCTMLLTLASAAGLPVTLPKQSARPRKAKSEFNNNVVPRRGAPKAPDPALLAADSRERGVFEALGLTLAGLAASAVLAGAASAHDVIDVADISSGLDNSGKTTLAWECPAAAT